MNIICIKRLISFARSRDDLSELYLDCTRTALNPDLWIHEDGDEAEALYEVLRELVHFYKTEKWDSLRRDAVGFAPCCSVLELSRVSRKVDKKLLVACGWHWADDECDCECAYCGIGLSVHEMTIEHVVPKSLGGTDVLDNLLPVCTDCNRARGVRSVEDFLKGEGFSEADIAAWQRDCQYRLNSRREAGSIWLWRLSEKQREALGIGEREVAN